MKGKHEITPFVYKWVQLSTGKWYVGSRTKRGCHPSDGYVCSSKIVRPLIDANPSDWRREILFIGGEHDGRLMAEKETELLRKLDAKNDPMSYNQHNGDGKFSSAGKSMSEETKAKIRAANKGNAHNKGRKRSEETKAKIGAAMKNKKHSEEHNAKIGAARKGKISPRKGAVLSEETKAKISAAHKKRLQMCCKAGTQS